jgi:tripartite-type tricarboxylate transporter receptor subunit TctC
VDPFIKEGKLKPLAFNGTNRMADYPKIPTLGERIPELAVGGRFMLVVPAGTPEAVQEWLHSALTTQMNTPEAVSRLAKFQFLYGGGDLTTIRAAFRDDYRAWERVLKIAHLPKE